MSALVADPAAPGLAAEDPILGDEGEYPSDVELARIEAWFLTDFRGLTELLAYMRARWRWPDYWRQRGRFHHVSTGGWSGHEDMFVSLSNNFVAWHLVFVCERRGGHYILEDRNLRPAR
jgi:hypothetical protein